MNLKTLIVTTHEDLSRRYFEGNEVSFAYFEQDEIDFKNLVTRDPFDVIYIRDPFNNPKLSMSMIRGKLQLLYQLQSHAYYIDHANLSEHIFFEDKWLQYETLGEYMPVTTHAMANTFVNGQHIAKKRLSSRSRDIIFTADAVPLSHDWIIQDRLNIQEELRVYVVKGAILKLATIKASKSPQSKTKVIGTRELQKAEYEFAEAVFKKIQWLDFAGFDIALTDEGLKMLEVNRSPQFVRYNEAIGSNLANNLIADIVRSRNGR